MSDPSSDDELISRATGALITEETQAARRAFVRTQAAIARERLEQVEDEDDPDQLWRLVAAAQSDLGLAVREMLTSWLGWP